MKAIVRDRAAKNFVGMRVVELPGPSPGPNVLKVKMVSSRINPVDMDLMKGMPFLKFKKQQIGGIDGAGIVVGVGSKVTEFQPGDKVFFYRKFTDIGTWAQEICIAASDCARVPENLSVQDAGAIALPLLTAYEAILQLQPKIGEKILIHGVAGGVGFQALQVAKKMGLYVLGTASQKDAPFLVNSGLDMFIDYKSDDFIEILKAYHVDYVFDLIGGDTLMKSIQLGPKKVVSVQYIVPDKMKKVGIHLPFILRWLMLLSMYRYSRLAKMNKVELLCQVTGPDGALLTRAGSLIDSRWSASRYNTISFSSIEKAGMDATMVTKVILFE